MTHIKIDLELVARPLGCFKCQAKRCDCCKNFLEEGTFFSSIATRRVFQIGKVLIVPQVMLFILHAVWIVICKEWVNFKTRLANYKSHIKH